MKRFKRLTVVAVALAMAFSLGLIDAYADDDDDKKGKFSYGKGFKNVIVLIPDGCDETIQTAARWYKGELLQVDKMPSAAVTSHMANSVITGSAAAATAFASGEKTTVRFLGIGPRREDLLTIYDPNKMAPPYAPIATVLEAAKRKGMATGIAATSRVTHATPAAYACHIQDRGWDNDIMEHMVYNNVDVVMGGGFRHLIPEGDVYTTTFGDAWGGRRTDGENLYQVLLDRGYQFVDNRDDMLATTTGKLWGLFDDSHMEADIDRAEFASHQPSLAEMVTKSIELLSQDKDGFFLMVEGSQVDWAGHNNDPIYMITDFIAFDDAVKAAVDFAKKDGETVVMAFPDHNTGGMKIGHYYTAMGYTETAVEDVVDPLRGMKVSSGGVVRKMEGDYSPENIKAKVLEWWGLEITDDDVNEILSYGSSLHYSLANVISANYTVFGWTTHGHNGETVPVWMYGAPAPAGTIDNTYLAEMAAEYMNVNLDRMTRRLYVDVATVTGAYDIVDSGMGNLVLNIGVAQIPISKDYMIIPGRRGKDKIVPLPGVAVYAPATDKVYVSRKALRRAGVWR
jgi:alkaline phosphatase